MDNETKVVILGNGRDTEGASIVEGIVLKKGKAKFGDDIIYHMLTPSGVAVGTLLEGEVVYSTMCLPLSYRQHIFEAWGLDVTTFESMQKDTKILQDKLRGCNDKIRKRAIEFASAMTNQGV